jgi:hypothetical protein
MEQYAELTEEQKLALRRVYERPRGRPPEQTWGEFLEPAFNDTLMNCVMVPWAGMWLGIEPDGHTHS